MTMTIHYKIIILGFPINGLEFIIGYNESLVTSLSIPSITIKNKHNYIAYHRVREALATGTINLARVPGKSNPSDLLNKFLSPHDNYPLMK